MLKRSDDPKLVVSSPSLMTFTLTDASRAAELRRVKALATLVLVGTLSLFVVAKLLLNVHPVFGFVAAFAEGASKTGRTDVSAQKFDINTSEKFSAVTTAPGKDS